MDNHTASLINIKFNKLRSAREELLRSRREEVYTKIPRVREIDDLILSAAYKMFSAAGRGMDPDRAVEAFQDEITELFRKKQSLLTEANYPADYLEPRYECKKCSDAGFADGELCSCYKNFVIGELYNQSNLGEMLKNQTFESFNINLYSDKPFGKSPSPRQNMMSILRVCREFVKDFDKGPKNLLFYGAPGLGKTFLSSAIANELIKMGKSVLYQSAGRIMSVLEEIKFGNSTADAQIMSDRLYDSDLLIIDDLGTEFLTAFTASEAFKIVNSRILAEKSTIISTNLSLGDLQKVYSERLLSRILGHYTHLKFYGTDIRLLQGQSK